MDDEQHVDNLIGAYALGALEDGELAEVERHLAHCPRCQEHARAARATAQALLFGVPLVEPPADLRQRVLARVHRIAATQDQDGPAEQDAHAPQEAPPAAPAEAPAPAGDQGAGGQGLGALGRWLRTLVREHPATDDEIAAHLARLMSDPACHVWQLAGTDNAPDASARLVGTPAGREAILLTSGLHALPPTHAYQVWFLRAGQPVPNALFHVGNAGLGRQMVHAPTRLSDDLVVAVTPEPAQGSPAPTGPIVLMGELSA